MRRLVRHRGCDLGHRARGNDCGSRLYKTDARELPLLRAGHDGLHQPRAYAPILRAGVNRNRPDPRDRGSLVQAVAADDRSVLLGYDREEGRMRNIIERTPIEASAPGNP